MQDIQHSPILIGINDRLFPTNFHPILQDIAFMRKNGFYAVQFHGRPDGLGEEQLGTTLTATGAALRDAHITAVMEIVVFVDRQGLHPSGKTPLEVLEANLPAITTLGCTHVHWHVAAREQLDGVAVRDLETRLVAQFGAGVDLGQRHGFQFAVEHNEPAIQPFRTPQSIRGLLEAVPGLSFVWDLNHTTPEQLDDYLALTPHMSMLHVADTPLPETNYHLPLGLGTIDFTRYIRELVVRGFRGPAILEIGGLPKSGGYGRDTDEALISSRDVLLAALTAIPPVL